MRKRSGDERQSGQRHGRSRANLARKPGEVSGNRLSNRVTGLRGTELDHDRRTHMDEPGPQGHLD